jgi:hypothetical protein
LKGGLLNHAKRRLAKLDLAKLDLAKPDIAKNKVRGSGERLD